MKTRCFLLLAVLSVAGCPKTPKPECVADPDAGTQIQSPCLGKQDGARCCLGASEGKCLGGRCDLTPGSAK